VKDSVDHDAEGLAADLRDHDEAILDVVLGALADLEQAAQSE
jgi:hypothetical protein